LNYPNVKLVKHHLVLFAVGVARSSRVLRQFHCLRNTPLHLVASLARPVDPSPHGVPVQLRFRLTLSSMWVPSALTFRAFYADLPAVAPLVFVSHMMLAHPLPFTFFNHFFAPRPDILHLALSSVVCALPATSDFDVCP